MSNLTFDAAMKRLTEITNQLEQSDLPLEESLKLFEEGLKLSQLCNTQLKGYSDRIDELMKTYEEDDNDETSI